MGFTCIGLYSYETLSQAHAAPIKQTRKQGQQKGSVQTKVKS